MGSNYSHDILDYKLYAICYNCCTDVRTTKFATPEHNAKLRSLRLTKVFNLCGHITSDISKHVDVTAKKYRLEHKVLHIPAYMLGDLIF